VARKKPQVHPIDESWLALGQEQPLLPQLDIIDSHIHLWDFSDPPYFTESFEEDARSAGISASVYVDCTMGYHEEGAEHLWPVGEVEFARAQAETAAGDVNVAAAIIGWADLCLGDGVDEVLDALEQAGGGRFRGVRTRANYDPDPLAGYGHLGVGPGLLLRDDYRQGVERLHQRGYVLDLYAFHTQLEDVAALARAFPNLPIILSHIGGPLGIGRYADEPEQVFAQWREGISGLAPFKNVSVKIGGFGISRIAIVKAEGRERPPSSQELARLCQPWVDHCLGELGVNRCLFGSNFPVDKVVFPIRTLVNAMKRLLANYSLDEQRAFFSENAKQLYKI
tara:strand:- start:3342 stop:4355 length:1014 start_codon:yes stop_codon:yes gene_type:complete